MNEITPFTSSLNICPAASPPRHHPISQLSRGYFIQRRRNRYSSPQCLARQIFKVGVTVIVPLSVSFMVTIYPWGVSRPSPLLCIQSLHSVPPSRGQTLYQRLMTFAAHDRNRHAIQVKRNKTYREYIQRGHVNFCCRRIWSLQRQWLC